MKERMTSCIFPWKLFLMVSGVLIFLTGAPYLYAYLATPPGSVYTGLHALTPGDFNVYFSQIRQAGAGLLDSYNLFSGKEGIGSMSMSNPFWHVLGASAAFLHFSPPLTFHLARLLLIPCFVFVLWQMVHLMLPAATQRLGIAVTVFSSGIGYLLIPFLSSGVREYEGVYAWPVDVWVPESNTFITLYHSPHLLLALILFLWILACFLHAHRSARPFLWQAAGGLAAAALFSFHPFHAITLTAVLVAWTLILGRSLLRRSFDTLFVFTVFSAPSIGWQLARIMTDEITLDWMRQNATLTPPLWTLIAGFGMLLPLACIGIARLGKPSFSQTLSFGNRTRWLLLSWCSVHIIFSYMPFLFQRRLLQGVHIPLALLAAEGLVMLFARFPRSFIARSAATVTLALLLIASTVGTLSRDLALYSSHDARMYLSPPLQSVFRAMAGAPQGGVVLAGLTTASFVPAWTGRSVYAAPGAHSFQYDVARRVRAYWFLLGKGTDPQRARFLQQENIHDVVVAPFDSIDPALLLRDPSLQLVHGEEGVYWFTVIHTPLL